jgi:hypothetical protein
MSALEESLKKVYGLSGRNNGFNVSPTPMTLEQAIAKRRIAALGEDRLFPSQRQKIQQQASSDENTKKLSPEELKTLQGVIQRAEQASAAPLGQIAQELAMQGEGDDTQLAHLRPGEVVLPPEFFEDEKFESTVQSKFNELGIDPEQAVVGTGVASLNPVTGLEEFGFFKKLGKKLKKVAKVALPVLGVAGFAGAGPLAGLFGKGAAGAATKAATGIAKGVAKKGIFGGTLGPSIRAGIGGFFNPTAGTKGIFGGQLGPNIRRGIGGLFGGQAEAPNIDTLASDPQYKTRIARLRSEGLSDEQILQELGMAQDPRGIFGGTLGPRLRERFLGSGDQPGVLGNIFGGGQQQGGGSGLFGGGLGDALKMGGIGALAAGLGKLAYEDAQKQKGVPLTPLTTMSPTGRYNIEAEIARRTGQPTPNPVEFGLLPAGTIPELSGGKPVGMQEGGAANPTIEIGGLRKMTGAQVTPEEIRAYFGPRSGRLITQDELNTAMAIPPMTPDTKPPESTQEVIEEAMEIVQLAEQEPALKETPEYQEALNILQRQMLTAAVMGKGPAMGGIKPPRNPLVGPASGVASAIGSLANTKPKMRMGRGLKAAQDKAEGIAAFGPNLPIEKMYGGSVMAYAQGGAVQMQTGGELDPSQFPRMDGDINGPGTETSDDIPAMLSDGEFVMTGRAVRGAGSYEMQADPNGIISLMPTLEEDRERGMDNMYKMMDVFASKAEAS